VQQVFKVERRRTIRGQSSVEVCYGITSLSREQADARRLLELTRQHWGIENRLFWVRDVTFGEDACRVRSGGAAQVMAGLRNAVITLLNRAGCRNKAAALRRYAAKPEEAIALVRDGPEN
jgi:predicted transposase YbfD/YdcC